jgi:hypothetical protein
MPSPCSGCSAAPDRACANRCTARSKRSQVRCGNHALPGRTVCKFHGGRTPIKHGLRAKGGPPAHIAARIAELERDPKILDHRHNAAHLYAVCEDLLSKVKDGEQISTDQAEAILPVLRELRRAATDYHRLALDKRFVDILEAKQLFARVMHEMLVFVPEDRHGDAIAKVEELIGVAGDRDVGGAAGSLH